MQFGFAVNVDPMLNFLRLLSDRVQQGMETPELRQGHEDAQREYMIEMRFRFKSEGDGEWAPLAKSTQKQRQYLGFSPSHPILRRLGYLYRGLIPGQPGNVFEVSADRVRVGYGGDFLHPGYRTPTGRITGGNIPLARIAKFHQSGTSRMPQRQILVQPSTDTHKLMSIRITSGVQSLVNRTVTEVQ